MYKNHQVAVVVPAYNEEQLIAKTLTSIPDYVDKIYVIDDGSVDNTWKEIVGCTSQDPRIHLIKHEKNHGVGAAIVSGYKQSLKDEISISVVLAGDNQMDPIYLPTLIEPIIDKKADFTKGNRLAIGYWKGMSLWRLFGNVILTFLTKIASGYWRINDPQNGYVAVSKQAMQVLPLDNLSKGYTFENDMLIKSNIQNISVLNVKIPAKYGNEKSKIKYPYFIFATSSFLFISFIKRIYIKYIKNLKIIGLLFISSIILIVLGFNNIILNNNFFLLGLLMFILSLFYDGLIDSRK
jgi:glycosyltransferase involved in cell wall biosynthesis